MKSKTSNKCILHNRVCPLNEATITELENSIRWYREHIRTDGEFLSLRWKENLALCEAERADRIGKK